MWYYLGQPTRSGYNYDDDDPDDAPEKPPSTWSDILIFPLIVLFVFLFPLIPLFALIVHFVFKACASIKTRIKSTKTEEGA